VGVQGENMKGIELPINILVIIAVAVIVLLGVIALYFSGFMGPAKVLDQNSAKQKYCAVVMRSPTGCQGGIALNSILITDFDADQDTQLDFGNVFAWADACPTALAGAQKDNLAALLRCYYGIASESEGLKSCGCA
jgi:hypothetical protein